MDINSLNSAYFKKYGKPLLDISKDKYSIECCENIPIDRYISLYKMRLSNLEDSIARQEPTENLDDKIFALNNLKEMISDLDDTNAKNVNLYIVEIGPKSVPVMMFVNNITEELVAGLFSDKLTGRPI
ncbi:MAG: hypothetical protein H3C54_11070 [Taibaiella sp.]|nr:hypothetical protein [Taibaiella sp.]